ncbi:hypothetical protein LIER_14747 [Lithospermum erythrorhizon]|uniref:Reverse transcriptase/retrotransposon-derived protein RNase H-like domain-containing protein n=1 Tax=Lithospermum erythrorhizon TaxID=34254 RepID=A0AAV3Q3G5_LITER
MDTGSSADILYLQAYDRLGLPRKHLNPLSTPLTRFTEHSVYPTGIVELDLTVGEAPRSVTIRASFIVVDIADPSYNGLIGRPLLNALRAIVFPLHLKMKFPTSGGIGEAIGYQKKARVCYQLSIPQGMCLKDPPQQKRDRVMKLNQEGTEGDDTKTFRLGTKLSPQHQKEVVALVREFSEVFTWGPNDMPWVDPNIALHRLYVDPSFRPIKQKKRNFWDEKNLTIQKEWDEECTKAFLELENYLGSPKLLTRSEEGEDLQLYLAVSEGGVRSVLVRGVEGTQNPIYYVSHVLHVPEESYLLNDKFILAVVTTARKLKAYFEAHPIKMLSTN